MKKTNILRARSVLSWTSGAFDLETETGISESQEAIDDFINQQKSANTNKKKVTDVITLIRYIEANGMKNEKIESLPASELDFLLWNFFLNARKKNGEEYEPATVSSFQRSIQRYLSEKKYPFNILKDNEFEKSRKVLAAKRKSLVLTQARQRKQTASCWGNRRRRRGYPFLIMNSVTPIQLRFKELWGGFYTTLRSPPLQFLQVQT